MKKSKLSTIFLCFLLVFTILIAAGCEKSDDEKKEPEQGQKEKDTAQNDKKDTDNENNGSDTTKKTVKLLKRNGVEWKENTKIKSKKGAKSYKVVWGDTLSLIARTWQVNCYKLAKYNGIKNIDLIEVDQVIYNYAAKK